MAAALPLVLALLLPVGPVLAVLPPAKVAEGRSRRASVQIGPEGPLPGLRWGPGGGDEVLLAQADAHVAPAPARRAAAVVGNRSALAQQDVIRPPRAYHPLSGMSVVTDAASVVAHRQFNPFPTQNGAIHDIFPNSHSSAKLNGDEGLNFFKSASLKEWLILGITCIVLFLFDLLVLQRLPDTFHCHIGILCIWFIIAFGFNGALWMRSDQTMAFNWASGYVLEWILSMDNLFVFHLVFETYKTPANQVHKAVFVGIIGAVVIRMVFFMVVSTLLHLFNWVRFPFGLLLIWSGVEAARSGDDDDMDVKNTFMVRSLKWLLGSRLKDDYDEAGRMFVRGKDGRLQATILVLIVAALEVTDVLFALDSVSAKIAQIPDQYCAFSSSVLAMFGLRAMFFIVKDLVEMFDLLQYGLCLILIFIGIELMLAHWIRLSSGTVCILIFSVFLLCILASIARKKILAAQAAKDQAAPEPAPAPAPAPGEDAHLLPQEASQAFEDS